MNPLLERIVSALEQTSAQALPHGTYLPFWYLMFGVVLILIGRDLLKLFRRGSGIKAVIVVGVTLYIMWKLAG